jgi:phage gp36-like protein
MADGDYYSKRSDVDLIYGVDNINRWADPENDGNTALITSRLDWANFQAETYLNGRLLTSRYVIPFTKPASQMIVLIAGSLAGMFLYDTRRIVSSDNTTDEIAQQRKNSEMWIRQILSGQLKILASTGLELTANKAYPVGSGPEDDVIQSDIVYLYPGFG